MAEICAVCAGELAVWVLPDTARMPGRDRVSAALPLLGFVTSPVSFRATCTGRHSCEHRTRRLTSHSWCAGSVPTWVWPLASE